MATTKAVKDWTSLSDATAALAADLPADYKVNKQLVEQHDAWQEGALWPGHRTGDGAVDNALLARVKPQFVSDDVVGELIGNRIDGLIGQEADVGLEPLDAGDGEVTPEQEKEIVRILSPLFAWWDTKRFWELVATAVRRESYAERASIRAWIPEANLVNGALPTGKSFADALDLIELDAPLPDVGGRVKDVSTQRPTGVILSDVVLSGVVKKRAEVWTVDPVTKLTSVKVFAEGGTPVTPPAINLGGRLPVAEMRGERIVDESVVQLQSLLNFIVTYTGRTVETAGARERYLGNVEPPLLWLRSAPTSTPVIKTDDSTGTKLYGVRVPWVLGAGIATDLIGLEKPIVDLSGKITGYDHETPSVTALDPVDPAFATNAADAVTMRLYKRGKQGHLALSSTAEASGVAYQQARAQFEADLKGLKGAAEGMIRDILEVVLAYAGLMSTEAAGILDHYRVVVTLHPSAGPIAADEARLATELRDKRAISQQTMLARVGVEDPVAEQAAIDADPLVRAAQWQAIAAAMGALLSVNGMTPEGAGWLLKLTPEQIGVFTTGIPPAENAPSAAPTPLQLTA
jgi:hypothetical protein